VLRSSGLQVRAGQAFLFLADMFFLFLAIFLAMALRSSASFTFDGLERILRNFTGASLAVALIYPLTHYVMGAYEHNTDFRNIKALVRIVVSVALSLGLLAVGYYFLPNWKFGRGTLLVQSAVFLLLTTSTRIAYSYWHSKRTSARPTILVGVGEGSRLFLSALATDLASARLKVVGILDSRPEIEATALEGHEVGRASTLKEVVARFDRPLVLMCDRDGWDAAVLRDALECKVNGTEVQELADLYQRATGKVPVAIVGEQYFLFGPGFPAGRGGLHANFWRLFDIFVAAIGLLLSLPVQLLIALVILLVEGKPVFFVQTRLGLNERPFKLVKFRTMVRDAEKLTGAVWASSNDPRVTRLGRFLRRTRLDELPQLWNVIKGEMSVIGPRPERPEFVEKLKARIPFYSLRFSVPPGLTGWAQVNYKYGATETDAMEKLQYELYYVQQSSVLINIVILLKTVQTVLLKPGS